MAFVDTLISVWTGSPSPPAGVTGLTLIGQTTPTKLTRINAWTVVTPKPAMLSVDKIRGAITSADYLALTALQLQQMAFLLQGSTTVDASPGTTIRAVFQSIFAGKTTTLANLTALVTPFDNATTLWLTANGYTNPPLGPADLAEAGLS
jgi:hypothetical protein